MKKFKYTIHLISGLGTCSEVTEIEADAYTYDAISAPFVETMYDGKAISIPVYNIKAIVHNEPLRLSPNQIAENRRLGLTDK